MIKKLFLTGPSGSGKTSALLRLMPHVNANIGGFVVQRVRSGEQILGYAMLPAREAHEVWIRVTEPPPTCFLTMEEQGLCFHPDQFTEKFLKLTLDGDLMILDEIGGIELQLPEIRTRILDLLNNDTPLLAVWKSRANLLQMIQHGKAPSSLLPLHAEIESLIKNQPKAALLTTTPSFDTLRSFLKVNGLERKEHL